MKTTVGTLLAALCLPGLLCTEARAEPETYLSTQGVKLYVGLPKGWKIVFQPKGYRFAVTEVGRAQISLGTQKLPAGYTNQLYLDWRKKSLASKAKILRAEVRSVAGAPGVVLEYIGKRGYRMEMIRLEPGLLTKATVYDRAATTSRPDADELLKNTGWGTPPKVAKPPPPKPTNWKPVGSGLDIAIPGWKPSTPRKTKAPWMTGPQGQLLTVRHRSAPADTAAYRNHLKAWLKKAKADVVRDRAVKVAGYEAWEIVTRIPNTRGLKVEVAVFQSVRMTILEVQADRADAATVDTILAGIRRTTEAPLAPAWATHPVGEGWSIAFPSKPEAVAGELRLKRLFTSYAVRTAPRKPKSAKKARARVLKQEKQRQARFGYTLRLGKAKKLKRHGVRWRRYDATAETPGQPSERWTYWLGVDKTNVVLVRYTAPREIASTKDAERFFESLARTK